MAFELDDVLFPPPVQRASTEVHLASKTFPGITPSSTVAIREILNDNHKRYHVFFNDRGFHNHIPHTTLTLWCLGADEDILRQAYEVHRQKQRPAFVSPHPITKDNWIQHLGDENFYQAYLDFFKSELERKSYDFNALLEEYIFSRSANFIPGAQKQPEMLIRFFDNLFHPMIHTGLGVEFSLPGTFAEGLAQAAMHPAEARKLIPEDIFDEIDGRNRNFGHSSQGDVHAFTILARIHADPNFDLDHVPENIPEYYSELVTSKGDAIKQHASVWDVGNHLESKLEELIWMNTLIYGVGGSENNGKFNADFHLMHLVTSSIFLAPIFRRLTRRSKMLFIRGYLTVSLSWYIARGRPKLDIAPFFTNPDTVSPHPPGKKHPFIVPNALPSSLVNVNLSDSWIPIIQSTLMHINDDHISKLQRALAEHASRFGDIPSGTFSGTELKGAELINGSVFLRAAGLTTDRLGWVLEKDEETQSTREWDRKAFFKST